MSSGYYDNTQIFDQISLHKHDACRAKYQSHTRKDFVDMGGTRSWESIL